MIVNNHSMETNVAFRAYLMLRHLISFFFFCSFKSRCQQERTKEFQLAHDRLACRVKPQRRPKNKPNRYRRVPVNDLVPKVSTLAAMTTMNNFRAKRFK